MKLWQFKILGIAVLSFGGLLFVFNGTGKIFTRIGSCKEALNAYQFQEANGNSLKELMKTCLEDGVDLNGNIDYIYLKRNLINFSCPQSWKYLSAPKPLVALASYPGSGNTWTRELIETATGLHTESIYTDWNFVGSEMCPTRAKIFIVKTHLTSNKTNHPDCLKMGVKDLNYSKAILILRNPYNALLAEFNRQNAIKPTDTSFFNAGEGLAPINLFRSEKWKTFVMKEANKWKHMSLYWLERFDRPAYVLVYEKERKNTLTEMYHLTKYLNIAVPFNSLYCLSSNKTGNYHRVKPKWMTIEKLYDKTLRKMVNTVVEDVSAKVGLRKNITDLLQSYLLPVN
ncbi:WSCD family member GA21586-like isoform X2 [Mercenaria mercenaria]|uniref:WSCD family member GA21586-like isoform X2 n=1 Tax=Mercenaria mercenaria TaxID=6596 RepID=UPI00234F1F7E|nr:WSCD family member GA21586-like isoform X2 [Mercenaria mercenaria]